MQNTKGNGIWIFQKYGMWYGKSRWKSIYKGVFKTKKLHMEKDTHRLGNIWVQGFRKLLQFEKKTLEENFIYSGCFHGREINKKTPR